jgi:hypothetical protein
MAKWIMFSVKSGIAKKRVIFTDAESNLATIRESPVICIQRADLQAGSLFG